MYYGVARLEFLVAASHSLKEKRAVVSRIKGRLESRLRLAVAEVDYQDLWQRSALGVALVGLSAGSVRNGLEAARREAEQEPRITLLDFTVHVARLGDPAPDDEEADQGYGDDREGREGGEGAEA
jgi:uncharacterized protein